MSGLDCLTGLFRRFRSRVLRRTAQFERLLAEAPEHGRFRYYGRSAEGFLLFRCSCLGDDNLCSAHDTRPALCRNYPSKSLYYQGGHLPGDCGYSFRAATFRDVLLGRKPIKPADFSDVLRREIQQDKDKQT